MTILITGSAGHLGEALVRTLREAGRPVRGLDRCASPETDIVGSINDRALLRDAFVGVDAVLHAATLHKPHVATHARQDFVDTNIGGTLALLEQAVASNVGAFVFTSTTSTFGDALAPPPGEPAAWITEDVPLAPKNIYGITKSAAEELCLLVHRKHGLPCVVLRTSRFFPEPDDNAERREGFDDLNLKVQELLYRRADLQDVVDAHLAAAIAAPRLGFARCIVSATTPFQREDLVDLRGRAGDVLRRRVPAFERVFRERGWRVLDEIDRVYVNERARRLLDWRPQYDFARAIDDLAAGRDPRSPLARAVPIKGYHQGEHADGLYPVEA